MIRSIYKLLFILVFACTCIPDMSLRNLVIAQEGVSTQPFFLLTIPKSGTHLMTKLLVMLTNRHPNPLKQFVAQRFNLDMEELESYLLRIWDKGSFPYQHTRDFDEPFIEFATRHPEYRPILMIRDLRDVIVSLSFHFEQVLNEQLGEGASVQDRLTYLLSLESNRAIGIQRSIRAAIALKQLPSVLICRFEDFVGSQGGSRDNVQKREIKRLAKHLEINLTPDELEAIATHLFGNSTGPTSGTFRKGKIGSWKDYFTEEHIQLFRQNWGILQAELGYPTP